MNTVHDDINKTSLQQTFLQLLEEERIAASPAILQNLERIYLPLARWGAAQHQDKPLVLGINGSQGSGKSTLSKLLQRLLESGFNKRVLSLSIDDLYKTRAQRQQMARDIHPLFITRGVPGTHDTTLGYELLTRLKKGEARLPCPRFNKALDDRLAAEQWPTVEEPVDIILFEGWCVAMQPEADHQLATPVNTLEAELDNDAAWRRYVNTRLGHEYQQLFSLIDRLIMLKIPSFENVFEWRRLQEQKLLANQAQPGQHRLMSDSEIQHFIMHFERLTRHALHEMPSRADIVLTIDHDHQVSDILFR